VPAVERWGSPWGPLSLWGPWSLQCRSPSWWCLRRKPRCGIGCYWLCTLPLQGVHWVLEAVHSLSLLQGRLLHFLAVLLLVLPGLWQLQPRLQTPPVSLSLPCCANCWRRLRCSCCLHPEATGVGPPASGATTAAPDAAATGGAVALVPQSPPVCLLKPLLLRQLAQMLQSGLQPLQVLAPTLLPRGCLQQRSSLELPLLLVSGTFLTRLSCFRSLLH